MGKMRMGILSPFKGKIGTVVGAKWRGGIWYQRAYSDDVKNPRSDNQQIVRARFSALAELAHGFLTAHTLGFAADALARPTMTTGNVFFRRNWSHVTASGRESVNVDFTGLVCAAGPAVNVHFNAPQFDTPLQVDVDFDDNMEVIGADSEDLVYVFVYCPDAKAGVLSTPAKRHDQTISVPVPSYWNGMKVHVYGFIKNWNGNPSRPNAVSDSMYIGTGNIG